MRRLFPILLLFYILPVHASPVYTADPDALSKQWHLQKIEAYEAWGKTRGSSNVLVAVIDTGVDLDHFDISQNIWRNSRDPIDGLDNDRNGYVDDAIGWDFYDGDNDPSPNIDEKIVTAQGIHHGTMVAGLIGAVGNNGIGGVGLAMNTKIMVLRALDSRGRGNVGTVIEAVRYAIDQGAAIINLSFVGPGFDRELFIILQEALNRGILVVGAVGNKEDNGGQNLDVSPLYPVCYTGSAGEDVILGVAATDKDDRKSRFSNYGKNCVDISAPGADMYGPQYHNEPRGFVEMFGNGYSGSSMAAPLVAGAAALIKALNPSYAAQEIRNIIVQTADPIDHLNSDFAGKLGSGRLNARRALELAIAGGSAVFGPSRGVPYMVVAPQSQAASEVKVLLGSGMTSRSFLSYAPNFRGGARLATGSVQGSAAQNIITGAGLGGGPHIRVFNPAGEPVAGFFAYDKKFRGGVNVSVGDVDSGGIADIITAPGPGGNPQIRVFDAQGNLKSEFFAYDRRLRGGANVAAYDINKDGLAEIITAPGRGPGYGGEIKIFTWRGTLLRSFLAYPANFQGGVNVAVGDVDADGLIDIITAPASGAVSEVRVYSADGVWQRAFLAYIDAFKGGVNLAVGDIDRDGADEIITGAGPGGGPHVIVFNGYGRKKTEFFPFDKNFKGGVEVGIIKL